jgi:ribosomal protein S18 acetylase RimI-like enzyme
MTDATTPNHVTYYKRYRMEADLLGVLPPVPELPAGHVWLPWSEDLLEVHAEVKYRCFCHELDGIIFPNLGNRAGCTRLMRDITSRPGFRPEATWLITHAEIGVGTVQGIADRAGCGGIQNLGVTPTERGKGLGMALLLKALHGFRQTGLQRATLEVTAQNEVAIRLYRQLGFRYRKTIYKMVEAPTYPLQPEWVL